METEARLQEALDDVMKGRTTFVIAHRLSTVRSANLILVLRDGEIVERGTHEGLVGENGLYKEIHDTQLRSGTEQATNTPVVADGGIE